MIFASYLWIQRNIKVHLLDLSSKSLPSCSFKGLIHPWLLLFCFIIHLLLHDDSLQVTTCNVPRPQTSKEIHTKETVKNKAKQKTLDLTAEAFSVWPPYFAPYLAKFLMRVVCVDWFYFFLLPSAFIAIGFYSLYFQKGVIHTLLYFLIPWLTLTNCHGLNAYVPSKSIRVLLKWTH